MYVPSAWSVILSVRCHVCVFSVELSTRCCMLLLSNVIMGPITRSHSVRLWYLLTSDWPTYSDARRPITVTVTSPSRILSECYNWCLIYLLDIVALGFSSSFSFSLLVHIGCCSVQCSISYPSPFCTSSFSPPGEGSVEGHSPLPRYFFDFGS